MWLAAITFDGLSVSSVRVSPRQTIGTGASTAKGPEAKSVSSPPTPGESSIMAQSIETGASTAKGSEVKRRGPILPQVSTHTKGMGNGETVGTPASTGTRSNTNGRIDGAAVGILANTGDDEEASTERMSLKARRRQARKVNKRKRLDLQARQAKGISYWTTHQVMSNAAPQARVYPKNV